MSAETPPTQAAETPSPLPETGVSNESAQPKPSFGWTVYAEQINGRFAMVGFLGLLALELFTHQDFFTWLGLFD